MTVDRVPRRLAERSIERPWPALVVLIAVTLVAAPGLAWLTLRTDGHALVPPRDPAVLFDAEVRQHFGLRDPLVVLIESSDPLGIYNEGTLGKVRDLTERLASIPGVGRRHVTSLATETRDRVYPGTLKFRPFLDPFPDTPRTMETLRGDVSEVDLLQGTLVSQDGRATALLVGVPQAVLLEDGRNGQPGDEEFDDPKAGDRDASKDRLSTGVANGGWTGARADGVDRTALYHRVVETVAPFESATDHIRVVGAPAAEALLGTHILQDLMLLVPLAMTVIALVVWLGCRRLRGVLLALGEVGTCLIFTFGVMGWLGVPVYLPTAVLPVILTTLGLADEIHIFWHYQRVLATEPGPPPSGVRATFDAMTRPVVLTSLTTSLAFLSFLASSIVPVRAFGAFAALGILFCLLFSLTVIPAALTLLGPDGLRHPASRRGVAGGRRRSWMERALGRLLSRPRATLSVLAAVTVVAGIGVPRLYVQDSWIDGFAPGSRFHRDTDRVNALLDGTHVLLVHLAFDPPPDMVPKGRDRSGPLLSPKLLGEIDKLEAFLRGWPGVGGVLGPASQIKTVSYLWMGRNEERRRIPETPQRVDIALKRFDQGRGVHRRREVIDDALRRAVVTVFLKDANYRATAALMEAIHAYHRQHLEPLGCELGFAGDVAVSQAMIPAIVRTQVTSLLLALVGALLAVGLLTRSAVTGLLAVLPASVAVLWVFGAMGWFDIPLGVATSMFCAITLGVGVDHGIHYLESVGRNRQARAADAPGAALMEAGPAIAADAAAIAAGFGLLVVSQVPANARLGLLVAAALVSSAVLTLGGLGSLLSMHGRRGTARTRAR
jgi:predicted RND superfamily exporter protein